MQKYELTIVLPGKVTAAKKKSAQELIEKLVKTLKGKVVKLDDWGEIELAYQIKKSSSGVFLHFQLELEKESPKSIDDKLRLEEGVWRYLLVKRNK